MANDSILQVRELKKVFKSQLLFKPVEALKGISFELKKGRITGFLGANGAGKTTTLKCILGFISPNSGQITFFGGQPLSSAVKARLGFLPERPYFHEYLSGRELLKFHGQLARATNSKLPLRDIDEVLKRVGLHEAADRPLRSYSKGMLQRIGIAQAILHRPDLVILDEPMTGLDPDGRFELREIIKEIAQEGATVFFSSHLLPDVEALAQDLVIVKKGEVIYQGELSVFISKSNEYFIKYLQAGVENTEWCANQNELQVKIANLIAEKKIIIEIGGKKTSLEEAFVKINQSSGSSQVSL